MIKEVILFLGEIIMGYISLWWFIVSFATAINIDHDEDTAFLMPFGYFLLILLFSLVIGGSYFCYRIHRDKKLLVKYQIIPFAAGLMVAILQTV